MEFNELGIGNKINMLRIKDSAGLTTRPQQYVSQLLDLDTMRKYAKISMPIVNKVIVPLEVGDLYKIIIFTSNGLVECMSRIEKRYKEGALYVMDVQLMGELKKYQRRQFFRLLCSFEIEHRIETEQESTLKSLLVNNEFDSEDSKKKCLNELEQNKVTWYIGNVIDISGGGISFYSEYKYEINSIAVIRIPVISDENGKNKEFSLRIIYSQRKLEASHTLYDIRGEYINMDNKSRELLVRYIFEEQRKRMKK